VRSGSRTPKSSAARSVPFQVPRRRGEHTSRVSDCEDGIRRERLEVRDPCSSVDCRAVGGPSMESGPYSTDPPAEPESFEGRCWVCGEHGRFVREHLAVRRTFRCPAGRSILRYQAQARALVHHLSRHDAACFAELVQERRFRSLRIYDAVCNQDSWPSRSGRARSISSSPPTCSSTSVGRTRDSPRSIECCGQEEQNVFTVPVRWPMRARTTERVDTTGVQNVHLLEPPVPPRPPGLQRLRPRHAGTPG
jgi:hypothetical protein